jgi:hypothetical protein
LFRERAIKSLSLGASRIATENASGDAMAEIFDPREPSLTEGRYVPSAIYFMDSDCIEYVRQDSFSIYDRIDGFLTLIYDRTGKNLIGFKLKGFKHLFDTKLQKLYKLYDMQFVDLVSTIEEAFTSIGDEIFTPAEEDRLNAYRAARQMAANDNVRLSGHFLAKAA